MTGERSQAIFAQAQTLFPGGVNSPVRAYRAVGGSPPVIASGRGATITDEDGRTYLDYVGSWGPLILGHAHPNVVDAICAAAATGASFGAPTARENQLAALVMSAIPSIERLRFVSSGTEATMSALRVARAFTKRDLILKFDGGYHGHSDALLVAAGSGLLTLGTSSSAGVPASWAACTVSAPYNDLEAVAQVFHRYPDQIAAIIVEPVAGNMGVVPPAPGFLEGLRSLSTSHGTVLVFDEVITGFRVARGGAQELYGVQPDLTCLGKIIGGGLPVGAYGGRGDIMRMIAPEGPVYQAGTLSGNPIAMAAGIATLEQLRDPAIYARLEKLGSRLEAGFCQFARNREVDVTVQRVGSLLTPFLTNSPVTNEDAAKKSNTLRYASIFGHLLNDGIYPPPSQFEAWFVSAAHSEADIDRTIGAFDAALGA